MDQRNLILAFVLSMVVLLIWGMLFPQQPSPPPAEPVQQEVATVRPQPPTAGTVESGQPRPPQSITSAAPNEAVTISEGEATPRFTVANDVLRIQVDERGRMIAATLARYRESLEPGSPPVSVLSLSEDHSMYMHDGLLEVDKPPAFQQIPDTGRADTLHLEARLNDGRTWQRWVRLTPKSYVVDIEDRIVDGEGLTLFRQVVERNPNKKASTFYEFAGPVGMTEDKLHEVAYTDLDEHSPVTVAGMGGWTGIMNRYFIASIIGNGERSNRYYFKGDGRTYQAGLLDTGKLEDHTAVYRARLYIGPKSIPVMSQLGVGLERSVDFGWFAFIAKPLHDLLLFFFSFVPNYGWCIIILVVLIKLLFFWPTQKSYESMAGMRKLQPEMQRLKEMYGDDRQKLGQEMMGLYKKHKVNPMGGCLPIIIQIPVFFALYKVLLMSIEMRHTPFIGWIKDLSYQDPYFVLPVLMGASMLVQQWLNPKPPDPIQAKVMQFLPVVFTALFLFFPAGLVLYWFVNNVLSIIQQWYVMKVRQAL